MTQNDDPPAVVLLSGGLDSATTLAIARQQHARCCALSFDYHQRHRFELRAARRVARAGGAWDHRVVQIDLSARGGFGGSALTADIDVPKDRPDDGGVPVTYVPARNTIFLSFALGLAEILDARDFYLGVTAVDYSGYPDCRPEFIDAFQRLANIATLAGQTDRPFRIHAPLIDLRKADIIRTGMRLGVDYALTHSCYDPDDTGVACGHCDSCRLRLAGFAQAGVQDPVPYRDRPG